MSMKSEMFLSVAMEKKEGREARKKSRKLLLRMGDERWQSK